MGLSRKLNYNGVYILVEVPFYTPVFRRDVLWYGDVRPSVRVSVRLSIRPSDSPSVQVSVHTFSTLFSYMLWHIELKFCTSLCFNVLLIKFECRNFASIWRSYASFGIYNWGNVQFSALFSYMLWHIELKFCIWLCFTVLQIKFECRQFLLIFVGVMPLLECRILKIHSFPHFSLTRFDILSWNFAFDFVLMYYRSSLSVVNFRQFL